jgi:soluble P-type ATPase
MLEIDIPGFGFVRAEHLVSDFTGTLSVDGKLLAGVKERLQVLSEILKIHIVTSDTFGTVHSEMKDMSCCVHVLSGVNHDLQKEDYIIKLGSEKVIALGNGKNDRKMLKAARIGISVLEGEGCSADAMKGADIHVRGIEEGLNLMLHPDRLKATLRF